MEGPDRPLGEIRLNVSFFQSDEENVTLLPSDDPSAIPSAHYDEFEYGDPEYEMVTEKMYEIFCYRFFFRVSRSTILTLLLLVTVCFAMALILVIVVCAFVSISRTDPNTSDRGLYHGEDAFGAINWLHYPVGELALRRVNISQIAMHNIQLHHEHHP